MKNINLENYLKEINIEVEYYSKSCKNLKENNLSLEQILSYQYNMGGIILTDNRDRAYFLNSFFEHHHNFLLALDFLFQTH